MGHTFFYFFIYFYNLILFFIILSPEQFTVKAHTALFEGEGGGGKGDGQKKLRNTFPNQPKKIISVILPY